ncbi:uncharacterized protein C8R40DRAFT_1099038 [Lentinula edodes]|uniref:uncharacterized protein n=1 Tax=Lentinula edodes TaxID=5353 RepID=UPI001E8CF66F|nr:uncharacterized protein C8R40DRAFT_1124172 [Lentinula edodes]XP_046087067.1 uncharacterized protein C8R40DRAFT_1102091 [Lentinula edodes]XP_046087938.1 uncharacterized protein C8R40DRAFT_1099038 [Lentinula edodes]KAH7870854.1 hypothetical protein C8R40DRAFT_1124172 [Lentinula edodes]KAH7875973.1 hypothetical protein C8R40DRAFT_1102091 [Lentinula edodes]KAH7876844.1 hypothetical protein C8R40DRAFT_1099038 [Lentinula edodes]
MFHCNDYYCFIPVRLCRCFCLLLITNYSIPCFRPCSDFSVILLALSQACSLALPLTYLLSFLFMLIPLLHPQAAPLFSRISLIIC